MAKKLTPITPGDVLLDEFLRPMNITQSKLSKDINVPATKNKSPKTKEPI